ncbi:MAG: efflux RND transporter periplasmic adaptor subunit [Deltaproteobacteria bacterium]|nr:efflux RND transporter periplasmic adaptor subunit [Deltaproteobacteria bacterium]
MRIHKRYTVFLAAASIVSVLVLAGCDRGAQQMQLPAPEVTYITIKTERVELTTELTGRTSALEVAEVRPQVTGIIQKRLFTEGQEVKEGQQLYQIDPALYEAALSEAKASLVRAEANLKAAQFLANRHSQAVKVNAVSKQEYDNAIAGMNQSRAEVVAAKAAVETATINMRYTKVYAPISGHIGISSVTPGALVTANQPQALATIQRLDQMYVDLTQSSSSILRLKRALMEGRLASAGAGAAKVRLELEDGQEYDIEGTLELADITVDTGTGAITVRAKFDNPLREITPGRKDRILFPGMFVRAILQEAVNENGILVPQRAVGRDTMGRATVYCVSDEGKVVEEVVDVERSIGQNYLIRAGLKPGDKVILDGRVKVRPGIEVKSSPYEPGKESPEKASAPAN